MIRSRNLVNFSRKAMLYLFHGDNAFASWQKVAAIMQKSGRQVTVINGDELTDLDQVAAGLDTLTLFQTEPTLLVIKRLFTAGRRNDLLLKLWQLLPTRASAEIIFWEDQALEKKSKVLKQFGELGKAAQIEEFKPLPAAKLRSWLAEQFRAQKLSASAQQLDDIIIRAGNDQNLLSQELTKLFLLLRADNRTSLQDADLQIISATDQEASIWELTDNLASGNRSRTLDLANRLLDSGVDFSYLIAMFARQLKLLYTAKVAPSQLKVHPFVQSKVTSQARNFSSAKLQQLFAKLTNLDFTIKQGKIDPKLGINLFLLAV